MSWLILTHLELERKAMNWLLFICYFRLLTAVYSSNDIVGCGGFLKSQTPIDFSKVDIKLFTKQGTLKESSDCAPTNGYYFIPLVDKGEYNLTIDPPSGWNFEPKQVPIIFNGVNDPCSLSLDINFTFKGFSVIGKVRSRGSDRGPDGIVVSIKLDSGKEVTSTIAAKDGSFQLSPILPGKYIVSANHPSLRFSRTSTAVTITSDSEELPPESLIVAGFDISGYVFSNKEPVKGVTVLLYNENTQNAEKPLDCSTSPVEGVIAGALCHVSSGSDGNFRFSAVPTGRYRLRPYYDSFQVLPSELDVQVKFAHVYLTEKFMVKGFSVKGQILSRSGGTGLSGVAVFLDGVKVTTTYDNGVFILDRMEPGTYVLSARAENLQFPNVPVKISPTTPILEPLVPTGVRVCGRVVLTSGSPAVQVEVTRAGRASIKIPVNNDSGGFCEFLSQGTYSMSVTSSTEDAKHKFLPAIKEITVLDSPIMDLEFSQLRAILRGRIARLPQNFNDRGLTIKLRSNDRLLETITLGPADEIYSFPDVDPGTYLVEVESNLQCFEPASHKLSVNEPELEIPTFVQTGYTIRIRSSHSTPIDVHNLKREKVKILNLIKGENSVCLPKTGQHVFIPSGCHGYDQGEFLWEVGREIAVDLAATSHDFSGTVLTTEDVPVSIQVTSLGNPTTVLGPLKLTRLSDSSFRSEFTYRAMENEQFELTPKAMKTVFTPFTAEFRGGSDCIRQVVKFTGERGLMIEGKVTPPLDGVKITLKIVSPPSEQVQMTSTNGLFSFGPLNKTVRFELSAEKESYALMGPDHHHNFQAHRLAQVQVQVLDSANQSRLSGVLLSLTGGENYRKNSITDETGEHTFHTLSPGEYFLRPMMKEYKLDPASVIIKLKAGETKMITLTGRRVSFSVFGLVTSLSGEPEGNVPLEAVGQANCSNLQEEGLSNSNGLFRIRGLVPYCQYVLQMKSEHKYSVYRITPPQQILRTLDRDIHDVSVIAFYPVVQTDVAVYVTATVPEHLKSLTLKVCKEDNLDAVFHVVRLDTLAGGVKQWGSLSSQDRLLRGGLLVSLPLMAKDGRAYTALVESTLNQVSHAYAEPSVRFVADRPYIALQLHFHAEVRPVEQESPRHLVVGILLALITFVYWQLRQGWPLLQVFSSWWLLRQDGNIASVDSVTGKRKGRPRKT